MAKEHEIYEKFAGLFPQFASGEYSYMRLESEGFEPLSLEWIFGGRISLMHTYELNGDLCYDPMMTFRFDNAGKTMSAASFEQSVPPVYQYFDEDGTGKSIGASGELHTLMTLQSRLNNFALKWLDNIEKQEYTPVKAHLVFGEDNEITVTFDKDGKRILPEKEYDLGYGYLGNGTTVYNRAEEKNGDYVTVAHIQSADEITFYDRDMPDDVKAGIIKSAKTVDWSKRFSSASSARASRQWFAASLRLSSNS